MTDTEWKEISRIIKEDVKIGKKSVVRKMIDKSMTFQDCLTVLQAFSGNKTINTPTNDENTENEPVNASITDNLTDNRQNQLERVENADCPDFEEITQKVYNAISNYCILHEMENTDLMKAPQRIWGAVSSYVGENVFKPCKYFRSTVLSQAVGQAYPTTNGAYDIPKIVNGIKLYSNLCDEYNKAFLIDYVAYFLGVSDDYLYNIREKLTPYGIDLHKKREASLTASLVDGLKNPTGTLATLNHFHGWTTSTTHTEKKETIVIYPSLSSHQEQSTPKIPTTETKQVL